MGVYYIVSLVEENGKPTRWVTSNEKWPGQGEVRVQALAFCNPKSAGKALIKAECTCPFPTAVIYEVTPIEGDPKPFVECGLRRMKFEECNLKGRPNHETKE
jgi:hypothetical protein